MIDERKSIWSWAMYDWANSAFATTVMAGFFPLFFKAYWADPANPAHSTLFLGIANSAASVIVAALSPFLGAIADRCSAKKKFLFFFTFLGIILSGALWLVAQGNWILAALFYVGASIGFSGGYTFYDALLPTVASEGKIDYASSLGFAMGYIGGGLLFLVNVLMFLKPALFAIPDGPTAIRLSFLSVAVWWALFSLPVFLFVEESQTEDAQGIAAAVRAGWKQLLGTLQEIKHLKIVGLFLMAYWLYIDGVDTIIRMAVDYGMSLGFPSSALITALLMVQFIAFPATLLYLKVASHFGAKKAVLFAIGGYMIITVFAYFMAEEWHFYVLAAAVGLFQGSIQALSRSLYARIIPAGKAAEFFGFYNMLGKFAVFFGPIMMGVITYLTGNARLGIFSIIALFVLGGFLLHRVDVEEGERIAREHL